MLGELNATMFFIRTGIRAEHGKRTMGDMGSLGQFSPKLGDGNEDGIYSEHIAEAASTSSMLY